MKFTLEIELGNDAMMSGSDVAQALRSVAILIDSDATCWDIEADKGRIGDINGNKVGKWEVVA